MSPLNTMEMVKVMNAEVQSRRSLFREPGIQPGEGRFERIARTLFRYSKREFESDRLKPSAI